MVKGVALVVFIHNYLAQNGNTISTTIHLLFNIMSDTSTNVGFIGLGVMGYPMAQNLLSKLPARSSMSIFDISDDTLSRFQADANSEHLSICKSSRQVAEQCVCTAFKFPSLLCP